MTPYPTRTGHNRTCTAARKLDTVSLILRGTGVLGVDIFMLFVVAREHACRPDAPWW